LQVFRIGDRLAFTEQPSMQELRALHRQGFTTLVNVRLLAEQPAPEQPDAERIGFRYIQIPIAQPHWSARVFDELQRVLRKHGDRPILVHSAEGARAGILALTCYAAAEDWRVEQLAQAASQLGLDLPGAASDWLRQHSAAYNSQTSP
jgi:protein tyrosine phosphatase (PTP) superfamily phosphohydrolase (DUF442 family)